MSDQEQESWEQLRARKLAEMGQPVAPEAAAFLETGNQTSLAASLQWLLGSIRESLQTSSPIIGEHNPDSGASNSTGAPRGEIGAVIAQETSDDRPVAKQQPSDDTKKVGKALSLRSSRPKPATRREIGIAVERLVDVFGRPTHWSDNTAVEYLGALDDLTADELVHAVEELKRNHRKFLPTPAEIREAAGRVLEEPNPRGWASRCGSCGCDLSFPDSRRLGQCATCRGALH